KRKSKFGAGTKGDIAGRGQVAEDKSGSLVGELDEPLHPYCNYSQPLIEEFGFEDQYRQKELEPESKGDGAPIHRLQFGGARGYDAEEEHDADRSLSAHADEVAHQIGGHAEKRD